MDKTYREDYLGEYVVTKTVFKNGKKEQTREWVDNPIEVTSHSKRACCIAPYYDERKLSMERLEKHRGGLLGRDRMQLYTAGDLWKHIIADFNVTADQNELTEIIEEGYQQENVVYTTSSLCVKNPGEFYLIPMNAYFLPIVTTVWLACFDGHKEIYLYGYRSTELIEKVIFHIRDIMRAYSDVQFYHVTDHATPDAWMRCINCKSLTTREFVSLCDV